MLKMSITLLLFVLLLLDDSVPRFTVSIMLSIIMGLSVRIAYEWGRNTLTLKESIIRAVFAVCIGYMLMFLWQDIDIKHKIVYYTFGISLLSMEIVNELIKVLSMGIKAYLRNKINNLIAKHE